VGEEYGELGGTGGGSGGKDWKNIVKFAKK
jgi:hypothetical protein